MGHFYNLFALRIHKEEKHRESQQEAQRQVLEEQVHQQQVIQHQPSDIANDIINQADTNIKFNEISPSSSAKPT